MPLTAAARRACGFSGPAVRLHGGEEPAAWRVGDKVVRVGGHEKDVAEMEWCHRVAVAAKAGGCTEAVAPPPLPHRDDGATAQRIGRHVVSVWPYVGGAWAEKGNQTTALAAARLHRALRAAALPPRLKPCFLEAGLDGRLAYDGPRLQDARLDDWLSEFSARQWPRHALHGDFYRGNVLASRGDPSRLIAVLDWDETYMVPPEAEVASDALEFTDDFCADFADARRFADAYMEAGGTALDLDDEALAQLMRHRLRRESAYFELAAARGVKHDEEDAVYHRRRLDAFASLRP